MNGIGSRATGTVSSGSGTRSASFDEGFRNTGSTQFKSRSDSTSRLAGPTRRFRHSVSATTRPAGGSQERPQCTSDVRKPVRLHPLGRVLGAHGPDEAEYAARNAAKIAWMRAAFAYQGTATRRGDVHLAGTDPGFRRAQPQSDHPGPDRYRPRWIPGVPARPSQRGDRVRQAGRLRARRLALLPSTPAAARFSPSSRRSSRPTRPFRSRDPPPLRRAREPNDGGRSRPTSPLAPVRSPEYCPAIGHVVIESRGGIRL